MSELLFIYGALSFIWAVQQTWKDRSLFGFDKRGLSINNRVIRFCLVVFLRTLLAPRSLYLEFYLKPKQLKEKAETALRAAKEQRIREEREEAWKKENPLTLYYNRNGGVTVVMAKVYYEEALANHKRAVRNGEIPNSRPVLPSQNSHLYCHTSAKLVPDKYKTGKLSDFDDLAMLAKLELRKELFVPFCSRALYPLEDQEKLVQPADYLGTSLDDRAKKAKERLLVHVPPTEVSFPSKQ